MWKRKEWWDNQLTLCWSLTSLEWKLWLSKVSCNSAMFESCKWMVIWAKLIIVSVSIGWLLISFKSSYVCAKRGDSFSPPSSSDSILNICNSKIFEIKEVTFYVACNPSFNNFIFFIFHFLADTKFSSFCFSVVGKYKSFWNFGCYFFRNVNNSPFSLKSISILFWSYCNATFFFCDIPQKIKTDSKYMLTLSNTE